MQKEKITIASFSNKQKGCSIGVPPFCSMFKLFSIVNKFPKMEKLFTILNSFLFLENFSVKVDRDANVLPSGIASYKYAAKAATFSVEPVEPVEP